MRAPRASANSYLCGDYCDQCECDDDGRIRIDLAESEPMNGCPCRYAIHVYVHGLVDEESYQLVKEFKDECDPITTPWLTCGKETKLTACSPETMITVPGRYWLENTGQNDADAEHVRIQVTKISTELAALRLQEIRTACCC